MKWFKFYGPEYVSDPKILSLSAAERSCWITLLCYASMGEENGVIKHLTERGLVLQSGLSTELSTDGNTHILEKFENMEMLKVDNGVITLLNWQKRQQTNLTGYERVKRYREKKRSDNTKMTSDREIERKKEANFLNENSPEPETPKSSDNLHIGATISTAPWHRDAK